MSEGEEGIKIGAAIKAEDEIMDRKYGLNDYEIE